MRLVFCAAFLLLLTCSISFAQQISGSITGVVKDAQQAVIAGAKVTLTSVTQGTSREVATGNDGSFVFTPVQPGAYNLSIESAGFKKYEQTDLRIFANDRILLGDIALAVGAVTESVTVEATATVIQAQSAERSGIITGKQVVDLALSTRNFLDLAKITSGVVYTGGLGGIQANGNRGNTNNLSVDGVTNVDTGSNGGTLATLNPDMIAEFKLITNSQQAEFGRSSGAQINVVTKSGGQDFHGTGYLFHRHEGLNANTWRNNQEGRARGLFRRNFFGYNVGGPVYIPGKFNTNKSKLFFFVGQEWQRQLSPNNLRNVLVPTELERNGDFSKTVESNGAPVIIRDPSLGSPFPGNVIPKSRLNADGVKILNFYPLPNNVGVSPAFNFSSQVPDNFPRREDVYRGDYNINEKWRLYSRLLKTKSEQNLAYGQWNANYNIPFAPMNFGTPGWSFITNVSTVINPTLTNEFIFGASRNELNIDPVDDTFDRARLNLNYKMPFASADPLGLIQNWRFNVPNAPFTGFNGTPFRNHNLTYDITDNVAKVMGPHTFKFGIYLHKSIKDQTAFTSVNGDIWFDRNSLNPGDTNWAFSNAILGNFDRLAQSNQVLNGLYRSWNVEWYAQDNWRVNTRLTLDYGIRFYWIQPQFDKALQTSSFNPALWNSANQAVLRQPFRDPSNGQVVSINPLNGEIGPRALIGSIVNTGSSAFVGPLFANGMGQSGQNYPKGLLDNRGVHYAPRVGLAYKLTEKTVIRAGAGIFYDRFQGNPVFDMLPNPPSTARPTFFFGNLADIPSADSGNFFPQFVRGFDKGGHVPTTYNWNFTIQRQLGWGVLFDVGYVGSKSTHQIYRVDLNSLPFGSAWLPQNQDPTVAVPKFDGTTTLQPNLYRPFAGFDGVQTIGFGASSNYHSLQVNANRRLGKSLLFTAAYTWSKVLGVASGDGDTLHPTDFNTANYGPLSFDRQHNLVFSYTYDLPKFIKGDTAGAKVLKYIAHDWQISGITNMITGPPDFLNFSVQGFGGAAYNRLITGSESVGPRIVYKGNAQLGRDQRTLNQWVDASVLALPQKGSIGLDSASRPIRRPGDHTWDISIFKNIPIHGESRFIQLRVEAFNAFNHARFNEFNRSATFNATTGQITNLPTALGGGGGRFGFGAITGTADPRIIQLAAKFYF